MSQLSDFVPHTNRAEHLVIGGCWCQCSEEELSLERGYGTYSQPLCLRWIEGSVWNCFIFSGLGDLSAAATGDLMVERDRNTTIKQNGQRGRNKEKVSYSGLFLLIKYLSLLIHIHLLLSVIDREKEKTKSSF